MHEPCNFRRRHLKCIHRGSVQQTRRNVCCTVVTAVPGMAITSPLFLFQQSSTVGVQTGVYLPVESGKRLSKADMAQQERVDAKLHLME